MDPKKAVALLRFALKDLGQSIPRTENHQRILEEAIKNWDIKKIPKRLKTVVPEPLV